MLLRFSTLNFWRSQANKSLLYGLISVRRRLILRDSTLFFQNSSLKRFRLLVLCCPLFGLAVPTLAFFAFTHYLEPLLLEY